MFITELWDSIFTPGTTPALITATHISFVLLITSLIFLIFLSKSIHFINLLIIALILYAAVIWFINELKNVKLQNNQELNNKEEKVVEDNKNEKLPTINSTKSESVRKRKV
ncbi:unnamed protein product [Candida verbasci]|uniref:Pkr1p n=1 Tax=Candida verbasci TaxID=1227364 RepID=A0A9W4TS11_9ASCO|nr:unnamed protein product [Candida verbasci]